MLIKARLNVSMTLKRRRLCIVIRMMPSSYDVTVSRLSNLPTVSSQKTIVAVLTDLL